MNRSIEIAIKHLKQIDGRKTIFGGAITISELIDELSEVDN